MTDPFSKLKEPSKVPINNYFNSVLSLIKKSGFEKIAINEENINVIYFTATYGLNKYHFYFLPFVLSMFHDINKSILFDFLRNIDDNSENIVLPIHCSNNTAITEIILNHKTEINQYRNQLSKIDFYYFGEDTGHFSWQDWESWEECEYDAVNGKQIFLED